MNRKTVCKGAVSCILTFLLLAVLLVSNIKNTGIAAYAEADGGTYYHDPGCQECTDRIDRKPDHEWTDPCRNPDCPNFENTDILVKKQLWIYGYKCMKTGEFNQTGTDERVYCPACGTYWLSECEGFLETHPGWSTVGGYRKGDPITHSWCPGHKKTFTVIYDSYGGSGEMASDYGMYGDSYTIRTNEYSKNGYIFTGWAVIRQSDGRVFCGSRGWTPFDECNGSEWKIYQSGESYVIDSAWINGETADTFIFYAQWAEADRFVSYIGNGADNKGDCYRTYSAVWLQGKYESVESIGFSKTGYILRSSWETRDKGGNYTGNVTENDLIPQFSGSTTLRTKVNTGYAVDITAGSFNDGTNIECWECLSNDGQKFSFQYVKEENGVKYWAVRNTKSGKTLDVHTGTGTDGGNAGANVQLWNYNGGDNQLWTPEAAGDGYFYIRSKLDSNLVLDLWGAEAGNGKNITVSEFHGGDNQKWNLWEGSIEAYAQWDKTTYKVNYDADGGTLFDENGNETSDNIKEYNYDSVYGFYTAQRAYKVSYDTNGGTASVNASNTDARAVFNGWNELLTDDTTHGIVNGWDGWSVGTWNWAAYFNGNPDLLSLTNNIYDTMWAILHYRTFGINEGRGCNGNSYWLPALRFKNLTANGGMVYVKANYTNGSIILPEAGKEAVEESGIKTEYEFEGWYSDEELTKRVGSAGDKYTPGGDTTLYARYNTSREYTVTVKHYIMDTDGSYPGTLEKTETVSGVKPGTVLRHAELADPELEVPYAIEFDPDKSGTSLTVWGSCTIRIYYRRLEYRLWTGRREGIELIQPSHTGSYHRYGEQMTVTAVPVRGYDFDVWKEHEEPGITAVVNENVCGTAEYTFTMPAGDYSIAAYGTPKTFYYSVDPDGGVYTFGGNQYTDTSVFGLNYKASAVLPDPEREGYYFAGWEIVFGEDEDGTDSTYDRSTQLLTMGYKQIGDTGLNVTFKANWSSVDWSVVLSCNPTSYTDPDWTFIGTSSLPVLQPKVPEHKPTLSYLGDYYGDYNTMVGYLRTEINGKASRIVYDFTDDYNEAGLDDIEVILDENEEHTVDGGGGDRGHRSFTVPPELLPEGEENYDRKPGYIKVTVYYDGDEEKGIPGYESTKYVEFDLKRFEWKIKSCILYQSGQAHKPLWVEEK